MKKDPEIWTKTCGGLIVVMGSTILWRLFTGAKWDTPTPDWLALIMGAGAILVGLWILFGLRDERWKRDEQKR